MVAMRSVIMGLVVVRLLAERGCTAMEVQRRYIGAMRHALNDEESIGAFRVEACGSRSACMMQTMHMSKIHERSSSVDLSRTKRLHGDGTGMGIYQKVV